jgi:hypothetical protein
MHSVILSPKTLHQWTTHTNSGEAPPPPRISQKYMDQKSFDRQSITIIGQLGSVIIKEQASELGARIISLLVPRQLNFNIITEYIKAGHRSAQSFQATQNKGGNFFDFFFLPCELFPLR